MPVISHDSDERSRRGLLSDRSAKAYIIIPLHQDYTKQTQRSTKQWQAKSSFRMGRHAGLHFDLPRRHDQCLQVKVVIRASLTYDILCTIYECSGTCMWFKSGYL